MAWQVGDIVNQVNARTQSLADGKFDLRYEFFLGLDEFTNKRHFWWRKKRFVLPLIVGTASYDFSALAPDFCGEFEEIFLINPDGVTIGARLLPILEPEGEVAAILNIVSNTPAAYLLDVTTSLTTLRLQAPSNVAQNLMVNYWAAPMVTDVDDTEMIPLVPQNLHYGLFDMLESRVFKQLLMQEDPRFQAAEAKYEQFVEEASRVPHWAGRKAREIGVGRGVAVRSSGSSRSLGSHR